MMTIRDILKFFSLDVCAKLEIIEQYKDKRRLIGNFPLALKIVCIISVFVIAALLLGLLLTLAIGYDYSLGWLMWLGCGLVFCAYFVGKKQDLLLQYLKIMMLVIGFLCFSLGADAKIGDGDLLMLAMASLAFFAITYSFFNNEVYLFFATIFICMILSIYVYLNFYEFLHLFIIGMIVMTIAMSLFPLKYVNLYPIAKAMIVYFAVLLMFFYIIDYNENNNEYFSCYMSFILFVIAGVAAFFKDKKEMTTNVLLALFLIGASVASGIPGVGYSGIVLLLGYILGSFAMLIFGAIFLITYLVLIFIEFDASLEYKSLTLLGVSSCSFVTAYFYKKGAKNAKK